jgi:hypothetical protein
MFGLELGKCFLHVLNAFAFGDVVRGIVIGPPLHAGLDQRFERRLRPPLAPAEQRERQVRHDPGQPRIEWLARPKPSERSVGADECFLRQIVGVAFVPCQRVRDTVHGALIAAHDLGERGRVATLCGANQVRFVARSFNWITLGGLVHSRTGTPPRVGLSSG